MVAQVHRFASKSFSLKSAVKEGEGLNQDNPLGKTRQDDRPLPCVHCRANHSIPLPFPPCLEDRASVQTDNSRETAGQQHKLPSGLYFSRPRCRDAVSAGRAGRLCGLPGSPCQICLHLTLRAAMQARGQGVIG